MSTTQQFDGVYSGVVSAPGKLRIAPSGLGWKSSDDSVPVKTVPVGEIRYFKWRRVARHFRLTVGTSSSKLLLDGLRKEDYDRLASIVRQYYKMAIDVEEQSLRGWNWGDAEITDDSIAFSVAGKPSFDLPIDQVTNTSVARSEVAVEFATKATDTVAKLRNDPDFQRKIRAAPDEVAEIRFYIPGTKKRDVGEEPEVKAEEPEVKAEEPEVKAEEEDVKPAKTDGEIELPSGEEEEEEDDTEDISAAQEFQEIIRDKTSIGQQLSDVIVTLNELLCVTPRGRFDIDLYTDFFRLRGKTHDYRIAYSHIQRLFLLPKTDQMHVQFVIHLDPPIHQGQTRYNFLVLQIAKDEAAELELSLSPETKARFGDKLEERYDRHIFETISLLFSVLTEKRVITPGDFSSHDSQSAVKCNVKTLEGHLYPLEKQLVFISRQPFVIQKSDIARIVFCRVGGSLPSAKTFDVSVETRSKQTTVFSAIDKEELVPLDSFFRSKGIAVSNELDTAKVLDSVLGDSDDDDVAGSNDEDEEDEDADFNADSDDDDVAEEFDSDAEGSDSDGDDDDDDDDDDEEEEEEEDEEDDDDESPPSKKSKN